jgi:hypothetical protein
MKKFFGGRYGLYRIMLVGMAIVIIGGLIATNPAFSTLGAVVFFVGLAICVVGGIFLWPN